MVVQDYQRHSLPKVVQNGSIKNFVTLSIAIHKLFPSNWTSSKIGFTRGESKRQQKGLQFIGFQTIDQSVEDDVLNVAHVSDTPIIIEDIVCKTRDQNRTQKRKHKAKEPRRGKKQKKACRIQDFYVSVSLVHRSSSSSVNWNGTVSIFHQ